jgi:hypothetical protein
MSKPKFFTARIDNIPERFELLYIGQQSELVRSDINSNIVGVAQHIVFVGKRKDGSVMMLNPEGCFFDTSADLPIASDSDVDSFKVNRSEPWVKLVEHAVLYPTQPVQRGYDRSYEKWTVDDTENP